MSQSNIWVTATDPPRSGGTQPAISFFAQRFAFTIAWGSAPSSGTIDYVSADVISAVPVTVGALVKIEVGGHIFWGICQGDAAEITSSGRVRTLTFTDVREFLQHDIVYGAFNIRDVRMLNGNRIKRWKHLLPGNFNSMNWTYTSSPYAATAVLNFMFQAPTMQTPWATYYHSLQLAPVYDIDCLTGKTLQSALQEVSDKQGLVFGLTSTTTAPYILSWIRKGEGTLPVYSNGFVFPLNSDDRRIAVRASGAAQRVRVLGGRNIYQVPNIELVPDWPRAWDAVTFGSEDLFLDFIYHKARDPETGKLFTAMDGDPDHLIGALRARVFAERMTVRQFVDFLGTIEYRRVASDFADTRLYHGRSRMDMPVFIYLREIVYRAFALPTALNFTNGVGGELPAFTLRNWDNNFVPLESLRIVDRQLTRIIHDPATGLMAAIGIDPVEGNGYAVAQGCRIDGFANANPETFDLPQWLQMSAFWQTMNFHIDDSGLGVPFILLDEPIFIPTNLFSAIPSGLAGAKESIVVMRSPFDPAFQIDVPRVRATLTFEAETFSRVFPTDSNAALRDVVVNVSQLNAEYYSIGVTHPNPGNTWLEIPFADNTFSLAKAFEQAAPLLNRPYSFAEGGYTVQGSNATPITSLIDRVTIECGPDGTTERVEFTKEATGAFESERDLDRKSIQDNAFPGQQEMLLRMRQEQVMLKALKQSKQLYRWVSDSLKGVIGRSADLHTVQLFNVLASDVGYMANLHVGTPLWRSSTASRVVPPWKTDASWATLAGVTVRENESVDNVYLRLQRSGIAPVRVSGINGDVHPGDTLVQCVGKDYIAKKPTATDSPVSTVSTTNSPVAGTAQGIVFRGDAPKLMWVHIGGAGGTATTSSGLSVSQFKLKKVKGDYLECERLGWTEAGVAATAKVYVAKCFMLRVSPFGGSTTLDGYSYTYGSLSTPPDPVVTAAGTERIKYGGGISEEQIVTPPYHENYIIYAVKNVQGGIFGGAAGAVTTDPVPIVGGGFTPGEVVEWLELSDGRAWAQRPPPDEV